MYVFTCIQCIIVFCFLGLLNYNINENNCSFGLIFFARSLFSRDGVLSVFGSLGFWSIWLAATDI